MVVRRQKNGELGDNQPVLHPNNEDLRTSEYHDALQSNGNVHLSTRFEDDEGARIVRAVQMVIYKRVL